MKQQHIAGVVGLRVLVILFAIIMVAGFVKYRHDRANTWDTPVRFPGTKSGGIAAPEPESRPAAPEVPKENSTFISTTKSGAVVPLRVVDEIVHPENFSLAEEAEAEPPQVIAPSPKSGPIFPVPDAQPQKPSSP